MAKSASNRILATPSAYARKHYLYVQEVGTLKSLEPHISKRQDLNSYLFFVVLHGSGYLSYESSRHLITAGDCVWINCALPYSHESSATDPWSLMWVHFNGLQAKSFYDNFLWQGSPCFFRPQNILPFTDTLQLLYQTQDDQSRDHKPSGNKSPDTLSGSTKSSMKELLAHKYLTDLITLCSTESSTDRREGYSISEKLTQIHNYIAENYSQKVNLDDLTEQFFISKYHLSREYKKKYGTTIGNDLTARRISNAKSMLRFSDDSIDLISQLCGFQDSAYFIKVFKKAENMTPLEYRRKW